MSERDLHREIEEVVDEFKAGYTSFQNEVTSLGERLLRKSTESAESVAQRVYAERSRQQQKKQARTLALLFGVVGLNLILSIALIAAWARPKPEPPASDGMKIAPAARVVLTECQPIQTKWNPGDKMKWWRCPAGQVMRAYGMDFEPGKADPWAKVGVECCTLQTDLSDVLQKRTEATPVPTP